MTSISNTRSALVARLMRLRSIFQARVAGSAGGDSAACRIHWQGRDLEVAESAGFGSGETVNWTIPANKVLMHRRGHPTWGEHEKGIAGVELTVSLPAHGIHLMAPE